VRASIPRRPEHRLPPHGERRRAPPLVDDPRGGRRRSGGGVVTATPILPYPVRGPGFVNRAVPLGWEVVLSRPAPGGVDLYIKEIGGQEYAFHRRWRVEGGSWKSPRDQNVETLAEYLTRRENERKAAA